MALKILCCGRAHFCTLAPPSATHLWHLPTKLVTSLSIVSCGILFHASSIAAINASRLRGYDLPIFRTTNAQTFSMGFKSGEVGGQGDSTATRHFSSAFFATFDVCAGAPSCMNRRPGCRRTSRFHAGRRYHCALPFGLHSGALGSLRLGFLCW